MLPDERVQTSERAYIAFVDSDDFISCDWFYPLIRKAVNENADMVLGNTVNIDESGQMTYYNNYRRFNSDKQSVIAPELLRVFFKQHGECFIWHTVWNKVYSKKMIERCLPYFGKDERTADHGGGYRFFIGILRVFR